MKVLASTFQQGDLEKVLQAMRSLPYDRLVLIGQPGIQECEDFRRLERLEDMTGHTVHVSTTEGNDFKGFIGHVAEVLTQQSRGLPGQARNSVMLNISGGSKLLGDAALLAAFELGIEAYHVEGRITRLPVICGATIGDRFTENQTKMLEAIGPGQVNWDAVVKRMEAPSRQAVDRVIRELKKDGLVMSRGEKGKVVVWLTPAGLEVLRALRVERAV